MSRKNIFLIAGILSLIIFLSYLSEPGPYNLFGIEVSIWIVRLAWLIIAISNFSNYLKLTNAAK